MIALQLFITGFLSLALENLGLQVLFVFHPQASETVALGLSIFLAGLAISNFIMHKFNHFLIKNSSNVIFLLLFVISVLSTPILSNLEHNYIFINDLFPKGEFFYWVSFSMLAIIYLLIPALAIGIFFPLIVDQDLQKKEQLTRTIGWMNSIDFIGAIFSSMVFGFIFIPYFGITKSFWLISILSSFCLFYYAFKLSIFHKIISFLLFTFVVFNYPNPYIAPKRTFSTKVLYQANSSYGLVRVIKEEKLNRKVLMINNRDMCGFPGSNSEKYLAYAVLKDRKIEEKNVLNIGLGCGITAQEIVSMGDDLLLDIVEINKKVYEATSIHFQNENGEVLKSPNVNLIIDDGIKYLENHPKIYDRIIIDIEEPTIIHSTKFYTQEGFRLIKNRLNKNGIISLWSFKQNETAKIILNTLRSVFKNATVVYSEGMLVFIASDNSIDHLIIKSNFLDAVERINLNEIATVEKNPYPKYYKIYEVFGLDQNENDPFVIK